MDICRQCGKQLDEKQFAKICSDCAKENVRKMFSFLDSEKEKKAYTGYTDKGGIVK